MPGEFEAIERLLLPKIERLCKEPFGNGELVPQEEHVPSIPLRTMREMTIAPAFPTGMDFRSRDELGRRTHRHLLYNNRRTIFNVWGLSFRGDPFRKGEAMQWTAHPVSGPLWYAEETGDEIESRGERAMELMGAAKRKLPDDNPYKAFTERMETRLRSVVLQNEDAARARIEAYRDLELEVGKVELTELPPPDPDDYPESHELLICENPDCVVRYWLREVRRGVKPQTCMECST